MTRPESMLADWLVRLERFSPHEIDLGLDRVHLMLDRLAPRLPGVVLHVAGTNGKGSTVAMAQSLLLAHDLKVGSYTSPHVHRFNERICIGGKPVADADIVAAFERIESLRGDVPLTYFEYGTIAALLVFEAHAVDIAVLEIGMGGRLDAVNAIEPTAGLITNISLDHCAWLGNDVESIAVEKAGIMRSGKPVIFASPDVPAAIVSEAERIGADLRLAGRDYQWQQDRAGWDWTGRACRLQKLLPPSLPGSMQIQNAAGALALLECAGFGALLDVATVNAAFATLSLPGRMQTIAGDRQWLLDVAHNPAAAVVLAEALAESNRAESNSAASFTGRTVAIIGMLDDKDVAGLVQPLLPFVDKWIAVRAASPRAIAVDELARRIANASNKACLEAVSIDEALRHARSVSSAGDRVLITGSFFVVGPALEALGLYSPA